MPDLDSDLSLIMARGERERSVRVMIERERWGRAVVQSVGVYIGEIIYILREYLKGPLPALVTSVVWVKGFSRTIVGSYRKEKERQ
jgi:hypothetical protein